MNRLIYEAKVLLSVALLFELTVLIDGGLSEFKFSISLGCGIESDAEIFADQTNLEAISIVSA